MSTRTWRQVIAKRLLVNESIETGHWTFTPAVFLHGHQYQFKLVHVAIRELTDDGLLELSRKGHLFLDLPEMQAIQTYFRQQGWDLDGCRAGNAGADLERALRTQDVKGDGGVHRRNSETRNMEDAKRRDADEENRPDHGTTGHRTIIIDNLIKSRTVF